MKKNSSVVLPALLVVAALIVEKIWSVVLLSLLLVAALFSCNIIGRGEAEHVIYDVEVFSYHRFNQASMELCFNVLPQSFMNEEREFRDVYDYLDGKIGYFYSGDFTHPSFEKIFIYIVYDDENYELAKACCFAEGEMSLSEEAVEEYNGFIFYDNYQSFKPEYIEKAKSSFPYEFGRFAYNDEKNTLVFMAYYMSKDEETETKAEQAQNDWSAFLAENFGMWYSFDE